LYALMGIASLGHFVIVKLLLTIVQTFISGV